MSKVELVGMNPTDIARVIETMPDSVTPVGLAEMIFNIIEAYDMREDWSNVTLLVGSAMDGTLSLKTDTVHI